MQKMWIRRTMRTVVIAVAAMAALLLPSAAAQASHKYPTGSPERPQPPVHGKRHTVRVCSPKHRARHHRRRHRCYASIQRAVRHAHAGDTVRIPHGTYRQSVLITGKRKRELRLIGDPKHPGKVRLLGNFKDRDGNAPQNGVEIDDADRVTLNGLTARDFAGNGFFAVNVNGYTMNHIVAARVGGYGLYAFNSIGGTMKNAEAYYNNDSGYYVGQTPEQSNPVRTFIKNVKGWGSTLGYSGTNSRYVTIQNSTFWDNGLGIVPNTLASERFPPDGHNVLINNRVFWNNFDYTRKHGNPFYGKAGQSTSAPFPIGSGIFVLAGQQNTITRNKIWGQNLVAMGLVFQIDFPTWLDASLGGDRKADCLTAQADIVEHKPISVDPAIKDVGDCEDDLDNARREAKRGASARRKIARRDRRMAAQLLKAANPVGNNFENNRLDFDAAGRQDLNGVDYFMFLNPSNLGGLGSTTPWVGSASGNCMGPGPHGAQANPAQRGSIGSVYAGDGSQYCAQPGQRNADPGSLGFAAGLLASDPTSAWQGADQRRTRSGIKGLRPNKPLVNCKVVGHGAYQHCKGFPK